jgi:hypothetical protein
MNRIDSIVVADRMKADALLREIPEDEDDEEEEQGEDDEEGEEDGEGYRIMEAMRKLATRQLESRLLRAVSDHRCEISGWSAKPLINMVARDGVERFSAPSYQQLADYTKDTKDREDRKDIPCVRLVCDFSRRRRAKLGKRSVLEKNRCRTHSAPSEVPFSSSRVAS